MAREIVCDRCKRRDSTDNMENYVKITKSDLGDDRYSLSYSKEICSTCLEKFLKWMEGDK